MNYDNDSNYKQSHGLKIEEIQSLKNIAEKLDDQKLTEIGNQVCKGYKIDEESRKEWTETIQKATDIATQKQETKNFPWPGASNVKYPLMTQASIEFAARQLPEIIQSDRIVKSAVVGQDEQGLKRRRAENVSTFMSYQLLKESDDWEDNMDKLLHILPLTGTVFKKTYYNSALGRPVSETCKPDKVVVNHNTTTLENARRISHKLTFYKNDIIERQRSGIFLDINLDMLVEPEMEGDDDHDAPIELLEQHCYYDLDGDGYKEPYIVIVHAATEQVLRIVHRFKKVEQNQKGEVLRIEPQHFFTDFHFIKSPDGGFYSVGLGTLLYPVNAAINTILNQLIDSGTMSNMQGGFIGRGLRLKNGEFRIKNGEWKVLDAASGTAMKDNIVPLPTKEPSPALFQLLGLLIESGKELSHINDVLSGSQPAQNVPATTILTLVEQGLKVYTAISKRMFRALKKEFLKLYELNAQFTQQEAYQNILDDPEAEIAKDFSHDGRDIIPVADPNAASDAQRLSKAQALMSIPTLDQKAVTRFFLEALKIDQKEIDKLLPNKPKPPSPEQLKMTAETEKIKSDMQIAVQEQKDKVQDLMMESAKIKIQRDDALTRAAEAEERIQKSRSDRRVNEEKAKLAREKSAAEVQLQSFGAQHTREKDEVDLALQAAEIAEKTRREEIKEAKKKETK